MKKILGICLIIGSIIIATSVLYVTYFKTPEPTIGNVQDFAWGVNTSCYQIDGYSEETAEKQIDIINQLGVNTVRMTLERTISSLDPFKVIYDDKSNDDFVDKLSGAEKEIVMVVDGDIIKSAELPNFDQETAGYQMGSYAAKRYQGKVKYYQIANEVTGTTIKPADPEFSGKTFKGDFDIEYSVDRYNSLLGWLKGLQRGIRESDSEAKIVITGHWHLYYIVDKLIKDGIDPDVIGWAWYSEDGLDITKRDLGKGKTLNLIEKLNSFKRPVWIIETNSTKGSYNEKKGRNDENYQADFFKKFIPNLLKTGMVKGIFVYTLFDTPAFADGRDESETHWGLVGVGKDSVGKPVFKTKKGFDAFRSLIKANSN